MKDREKGLLALAFGALMLSTCVSAQVKPDSITIKPEALAPPVREVNLLNSGRAMRPSDIARINYRDWKLLNVVSNNQLQLALSEDYPGQFNSLVGVSLRSYPSLPMVYAAAIWDKRRIFPVVQAKPYDLSVTVMDQNYNAIAFESSVIDPRIKQNYQEESNSWLISEIQTSLGGNFEDLMITPFIFNRPPRETSSILYFYHPQLRPASNEPKPGAYLKRRVAFDLPNPGA
jgi:hypothetical protein